MARIICDVDGVLADFVGGVGALIGRPVMPQQWDFLENELTPTEHKMVKLVLKRSWFWRGLDMVPGALWGIKQLRDSVHDVIFATQPWPTCRTWWYERVKWLEEHINASRAECVAIVRKELLEGDTFIDDRAPSVEAWVAAHPTKHAYLFMASYNTGAAILGHPRVHPFYWTETHVNNLLRRLEK